MDFLEPIRADGRYRVRGRCTGIEDKAKLTVFNFEYTISRLDAGKEVLACRMETSLVLVGVTGSGNHGRKLPIMPKPLKEQLPTHTFQVTTMPQQAIIYRLSGDYNQLHIDQASA